MNEGRLCFLATIERFEELDVWIKARELTKVIYKITGEKEFSKDYSLRDQLRSAAVSVMSNIAEGFERQGDREFQHFLSIAKGSAGEVRSQLYIVMDAGLINEDQFRILLKMAEEISRMICGLITYLNKSNRKLQVKS